VKPVKGDRVRNDVLGDGTVLRVYACRMEYDLGECADVAWDSGETKSVAAEALEVLSPHPNGAWRERLVRNR